MSFIIYRSVQIDTASRMTCTSSSPYKPALVMPKVFLGPYILGYTLIFARTSGILIHPAVAVWPQQTWAKNWGLCPLFGEWEGPRPTSKPSGILIHPDVWPQQTWLKIGGAVRFFRGAGSPSTTVWPGLRPTYIHAKWHLDPSSRLATIDMARNWGGLCPLFGRWGSWVPI